MNKRALISLIGCLFLSLGFFSCKKADIDGNPRRDPRWAAELRNSPVRVTVGDRHYLGYGTICLDLMPGAGRPIMSSTGIIESDSLLIPDGLHLKRQYVIREDEVWAVDYQNTNENLPRFMLIGHAHTEIDPEHPETTPYYQGQDDVDIVCEFEEEGRSYRVLIRNSRVEVVH